MNACISIWFSMHAKIVCIVTIATLLDLRIYLDFTGLSQEFLFVFRRDMWLLSRVSIVITDIPQ